MSDGKDLIEIISIGFEPLLTEKEYRIYKLIGKIKSMEYHKNKLLNFMLIKLSYLADEDNDEYEEYYEWIKKVERRLDRYSYYKKFLKVWFKEEMKDNVNISRELYDDRKFTNEDQFRNIVISESDLTRSFECLNNQHSDEIISVTTYYTEILESIMKNGFNYKDKHFVFFTAGAGQTRNKKSTFVNEKLLDKNIMKLMCGLTREEINNQGGMNKNKYLAYTSLCQTNSSIWSDFDIDKAIVVEDIEYYLPNEKVRKIYTETPQDKEELLLYRNEIDEITIKLRNLKDGENNKDNKEEILELKNRKKILTNRIKELTNKYHSTEIREMDVMIPYTDGFGVALKKIPNQMVRLPFVKGLISYMSREKFKDFCKENNYKIGKITDIYGKEHSISNVDYIFTKSQFKMYKYFHNELDENGNIIKTGWEKYKENFKEYGCSACVCNVEDNVKLNAKTNYQVLQTLTTEMTDEDILNLAQEDIQTINGVGVDYKCSLKLLGAEENNEKSTFLQKSLLLYPEMLKDSYVKRMIKDLKASMVKKMYSGKFSINGAYTFILPEPIACLQWWFCGERDLDKLGIVKENKVYCSLFDKDEKLDCLRSPHLDHAHCIRINEDKEVVGKYYTTQGLYVGVKDIMSKLLMNDFDGDKSLVHNNKTIIKCAESYQSKYKMIPNYYDMPKANPEILTNESLFNGIVMAYHHGNIGTPSNEITKVYDTLDTNSTKEEIEHAIDIVALRCCDVNYVIDFAKTLYKPLIPKNILEQYKEFSKRKVPYFFMYAKGKTRSQVEDKSTNNINRISNIVKNNRITFKDMSAKYSYKELTTKRYNIDLDADINKKIIELYNYIETQNRNIASKLDTTTMEYDEKKKHYILTEYNRVKQLERFKEYINMPIDYISDVLVVYLHKKSNKDTLWKLFGEQIYKNLLTNIGNTKLCENCGKRFEYNKFDSKKVLCEECYNKKRREDVKNNVKKLRENRV